MNKKLLLILLTLCLIVPFIFSSTADAAVKISVKSKTLNIGESFNLKITGTTKKVTWSSSKKSVATVSSNGKVIAKVKGSTTITAKVNSKKYICEIKVIANAQKTLPEINDWLIADIWNAGFCDLKWYYSNGTDSTGEKMNVENTLKKLDKAMTKAASYNSFIKSLSGSKYKNLKKYWPDMYTEMQSLYKTVKKTDFSIIDSDNDLGADLFNTYMLDVYEELCHIAY